MGQIAYLWRCQHLWWTVGLLGQGKTPSLCSASLKSRGNKSAIFNRRTGKVRIGLYVPLDLGEERKEGRKILKNKNVTTHHFSSYYYYSPPSFLANFGRNRPTNFPTTA